MSLKSIIFSTSPSSPKGRPLNSNLRLRSKAQRIPFPESKRPERHGHLQVQQKNPVTHIRESSQRLLTVWPIGPCQFHSRTLSLTSTLLQPGSINAFGDSLEPRESSKIGVHRSRLARVACLSIVATRPRSGVPVRNRRCVHLDETSRQAFFPKIPSAGPL